MIKFDDRKSCYFEAECEPFGIQKVFFPSNAYKPKMIQKKRFVIFGSVTNIELGHEFCKRGFNQTVDEFNSIKPIWNKIWSESLNAIQAHRREWEYLPFQSGDEFEISLMPCDRFEVKFVI